MPSPHTTHVMRSPLYPGNSSGGSSTFTHCGGEQVVVRHFPIRQHLLLILIFDFGMQWIEPAPSTILWRRCGAAIECPVSGPRRAVRSTNVAAILPQSRNFRRPLAQAASGDNGDGIGRAAVDFHKGDEAFAVFAMGIVNAEFLQSQHREAHAQHLPGAKMSMGLFGVAKIFVEGFHETSCQRSASALSLPLIRLGHRPLISFASGCRLW